MGRSGPRMRHCDEMAWEQARWRFWQGRGTLAALLSVLRRWPHEVSPMLTCSHTRCSSCCRRKRAVREVVHGTATLLPGTCRAANVAGTEAVDFSEQLIVSRGSPSADRRLALARTVPILGPGEYECVLLLADAIETLQTVPRAGNSTRKFTRLVRM
jgi:hypothetical protein